MRSGPEAQCVQDSHLVRINFFRPTAFQMEAACVSKFELRRIEVVLGQLRRILHGYLRWILLNVLLLKLRIADGLEQDLGAKLPESTLPTKLTPLAVMHGDDVHHPRLTNEVESS
jgi:hypothetical protein